MSEGIPHVKTMKAITRSIRLEACIETGRKIASVCKGREGEGKQTLKNEFIL